MESFPDTALLYTADTSTSATTAMTPYISDAVMITVITALLHQEPTHCHIRYLTLALSLASAFFLATVFDSFRLIIIDLNGLNWGFDLI